MSETTELGGFLRARRAELDPSDFGLPPGVNQRRVAGLRREELAQLAGISVDYYTRLEQGRARNVSDTILDAIARTLRLTSDEETYLRNLATPKRRRQSTPSAPRVRPELQHLLDAMQVPAFVFGRYMDVLAWNRLANALSFDFASMAPEERNIPRLFFLDDSAAEFHPQWAKVTGEIVANLRAEAGRHQDDPKLAQLVGELSMRSEDFRQLWARHQVQDKAHCTKLVRNPIVGDLELRYETLRLPDDDLAVVTYTAEPGSESERRLNLLASWVTEAARAR